MSKDDGSIDMFTWPSLSPLGKSKSRTNGCFPNLSWIQMHFMVQTVVQSGEPNDYSSFHFGGDIDQLGKAST